MPIFKVTMTEETTTTFVAYVEAPTKSAADQWASMVEDAGVVGCETRCTDGWGAVEEIEEVPVTPAGWRLNRLPEPSP